MLKLIFVFFAFSALLYWCSFKANNNASFYKNEKIQKLHYVITGDLQGNGW